ncbi:hypothetical protein Tco_1325023, partial [Tanacetum coccineum]
GGQLNAAPVLEVENFTNWKKRFMCHIIGIEPYFQNIIKNGPYIPMTVGQRKPEVQWTPDERKAANLDQRLKSLIISSDVKESRVMDLKLCYNTYKFKEAETLTQTFIRYKALMNKLVNDGIKFSKLEINTGFINGLPKKWLSLCQSLKNTNHVKDSELASLFGKLKYEENLIDNIYETEKTLVSATPLSTAFFSTSIVQDFQDSPDDEEDTRSSQEYLNDLEEEYQARALLAKSKRFFKKDTQRFSSAKSTDQTECHKCSKKDLRPTKDFEAKYNKAKDKSPSHPSAPTHVVAEMHKEAQQAAGGPTSLGATSKEGAHPQLSSGMSAFINIKPVHSASFTFHSESASRNDVSADSIAEADPRKSAPNGSIPHQQGIDEGTKNYSTDHIFARTNPSILVDKTKSARDSSNKVNQCISEQIPTQKKRILGVDQLTEDPSSSGQKDLVFVKSLADDTKVSIPGVERPWLSEAEGFILPNHDTGRILPAESQRNTIDPSVVVTDFSTTIYDSADESSVCSTPLPPLKKLNGAEPIYGPKTIKLILRSKSTFKNEALKGVIINKPFSAPAKRNKSSPASKVYSAPAGKLKSVKIEDDHPLAIVMKELNNLKLQVSKKNHLTPECDIKKPIWYLDSGCSRHMTGVKSYLHKYVEQSGPKVVFGDDSTCTTEGYGSIKCNGIVFTKVTFVNGLKYNIISISQLCDAKYIVQFHF